MITTELVLSIIGLCVALGSLYFSRKDRSIGEVSKLENRLSTLEANRFTQADRDSLIELELKMGLFWGIVETEFPRILIKAHTPHIDSLLVKASKSGISSLTDSEHHELIARLDQEYMEALDNEDSGRGLAISFFRAILKFNKTKSINACLKE